MYGACVVVTTAVVVGIVPAVVVVVVTGILVVLIIEMALEQIRQQKVKITTTIKTFKVVILIVYCIRKIIL